MMETSAIRLDEILFATDFSEASARALPYAGAIARGFGSTLRVFHVISKDEYEHVPAPEREAMIEKLHRGAEARLAQMLAASHVRGIRCEVEIVHGEILRVLGEAVARRKPDLIVLGMHGRHGLEKTMLGSVAEEILYLEEVPVLAIGPSVRVEPEEEVRVRRVLYVADFSKGSQRALHYAEALVRRWGAQLIAVHVLRDIWEEPRASHMTGDEFLRTRLKEEGRMEKIEDLEPELVVEFGSPEERILQVAERYEAQLMVVSVPPKAHPALSAHLPGPLAYDLAAQARCPVLGVRRVAGEDK